MFASLVRSASILAVAGLVALLAIVATDLAATYLGTLAACVPFVAGIGCVTLIADRDDRI